MAFHDNSGYLRLGSIEEDATQTVKIMDNAPHSHYKPLFKQWSFSSKRLIHLRCDKERYRKSFLSTAIILFNKCPLLFWTGGSERLIPRTGYSPEHSLLHSFITSIMSLSHAVVNLSDSLLFFCNRQSKQPSAYCIYFT